MLKQSADLADAACRGRRDRAVVYTARNASHLGTPPDSSVPVIMMNKVAQSYKPPLMRSGRYPGLSAIVDSDGSVLKTMDGNEGIGIADIS
jgi:predicted amidohydrolase